MTARHAIPRRLAAVVLLALAGLSGAAGPAPAGDTVTVFAAASTTDAVNGVLEAYEEKHAGARVRASFAASSTLAKQIARGAPADLYISADAAWMDYLAEREAIVAGTRTNLLGNRLVLVAPARSAWDLDLAPGAPLVERLGDRRLAVGDPAHVPAGIYARHALESLGLWSAVRGRAAFASDVRAALALVARGEAAAGVVYRTDAAITDDVRVVDVFPAGSHAPIVYPLAVVAGRDGPAVRAVYDFLRGPAARRIFRANGFIEPGAQG